MSVPTKGGRRSQIQTTSPTPRRESGVRCVGSHYEKGKGGISFVLATCRPTCTVPSHHPLVHAHLLGRYADPSGACVYRSGPVTKCNPFLRYVLLVATILRTSRWREGIVVSRWSQVARGRWGSVFGFEVARGRTCGVDVVFRWYLAK